MHEYDRKQRLVVSRDRAGHTRLHPAFLGDDALGSPAAVSAVGTSSGRLRFHGRGSIAELLGISKGHRGL